MAEDIFGPMVLKHDPLYLYAWQELGVERLLAEEVTERISRVKAMGPPKIFRR